MEEYPTQLNVPYSYPKPLKTMTNGFSLTYEPVFFDERMYLYDKFYKLIKKISYDKNKKGPYSFESYTPNAVYPVFGLLRFPEYHQFSDAVTYHKSINIWKEKVLKFCTGVLLPSPILCKTFIPSRPSILDPSTPFYRKFDPKKYPLQPKNMMHLHSALLSDTPPNYFDIFPQQFPKRDTIVLKDHLVEQKQWQSQMVVKEPLTFIYADFKEFDEAYKNWKNLVSQRFNVQPPIPVQQFQNILGIPKYEPLSSPKVTYNVEKQKGFLKGLPNYSWVDQVNVKTTNIQQLKFQHIKIKRIQVDEKDYEDIRVFGVNKQEFIDDFMQYGVHCKVLLSDFPIYPFTYIKIRVDKALPNKFKKWKTKIDSTNISQLMSFIDLDFDWEWLGKMMISKINGAKIIDLICCKNYHLILNQLFHYASKSNCHAYRVSILLRILLFYGDFHKILPSLFQADNLFILYEFTKLVILTHDFNVQIYPIPENLTEITEYICQAHFGSLLIHAGVLQVDSEAEQFLHKTLHYLTDKIGFYFALQENQKMLFNALKSNNFNSKSRAYLVLSTLYSDRIMETLFGQNLMDKLLSILSHKVGKMFVYNCLLSNGYKLAILFTRACTSFTGNNISHMDINTSFIFGFFIDILASFMNLVKGYSPIAQINHMFQATLNSLNQDLIPLVYSIIKFFSNLQLMQPDNKYCLDGILGSFISQLSIQYVYEHNVDYADVIKFLKPCIRIPDFPAQFLASPQLVLAIMNELDSSNVTFLISSWLIFTRTSQTADNMQKLFGIQGIDKKLQRLASSEHPTVVYEFCKFISRVAKQGAKTLDQLEALIQPSMGRFACTIKNAEYLFGMSKTTRSINDMLTSIYAANSRFAASLSPHLMSLGFDIRRYIIRKSFIFK